jgi:hypothetical protein
MRDMCGCGTFYSVQQLEELKSAHFTVCQKPWGCWKTYANRLCGELHHR